MSNAMNQSPAICCLPPPPVLRTLPGFGNGIPGLGPPPKPPWIKYSLECNKTGGVLQISPLSTTTSDTNSLPSSISSTLSFNNQPESTSSSYWLQTISNVRTSTARTLTEAVGGTVKGPETTTKSIFDPASGDRNGHGIPPSLPNSGTGLDPDATSDPLSRILTTVGEILGGNNDTTTEGVPESEKSSQNGALLSRELIAVVCLSVLLALSCVSIALCWYWMVKKERHRRRINPEDPTPSKSFLHTAREKARLLLLDRSSSAKSSKTVLETDDDEESPVPSRSPSLENLKRQDSSTSGISTGCDNDDTTGERTALRKKRHVLDPDSTKYSTEKRSTRGSKERLEHDDTDSITKHCSNNHSTLRSNHSSGSSSSSNNSLGGKPTTTRHFDSAYLPILRPISSSGEPTTRHTRTSAQNTLPDVSESPRIALSRATRGSSHMDPMGNSVPPPKDSNSVSSIRDSSLLPAPRAFPVLGLSGKQRILLEPLTLSHSPKKAAPKKRRKVRKKRQPGRLSQSLEEEDEEEEVHKVELDSPEGKMAESYA